MHEVVPSCREVARLLAEGELEKSSRLTRLRVRFHLSMCQHCDRFARQLELISQAFKNFPKPDSDSIFAVKQRIMARMKRERKNHPPEAGRS